MSVMTQSRGSEMVPIPTLSEILRDDPHAFVEKYADVAAINLACAVGLPGAEGLDIPKLLRALDAMATIVRQKTLSAWRIYERNPAEFYDSQNVFRVIYMLDALHRQFGVRYNPARIDRSDETFDPLDSGDLFIHGILSDKRTGTCSSLPVFAVAIGRRLGYPFKLVKAPEHLFFRWDDGSERFNVEYNGFGGNIYPDDYYMAWPVPWTTRIQRAQQHARWLSSLGAQEEVECFLGYRFLTLNAQGQWDEALSTLLAAERFNPRAKPLHAGLREELLRKIARRDGLPQEAASLAAAFLAGVDLKQLLQAMKGETFPMSPKANAFGLDPFKRRYMDPTTGRFTSLDAYAGDPTDPLSFNKYLYTQADPINGYDPTGDENEAVMAVGASVAMGVLFAPPGWPVSAASLVWRLQSIQKKEIDKTKAPDLFKVMGLDKFFEMEDNAAKFQVKGLEVDPTMSELNGLYTPGTNIMTLPKSVWVTDWSNVVHETVHAVDVQKGWYLTDSILTSKNRQAEGLAYGAVYVCEFYEKLASLYSRRKIIGERNFNDAWKSAWDEYNAGKFDTEVVWQRLGLTKGKEQLTKADLDDVARKLHLEIDYKKIAPLFGK